MLVPLEKRIKHTICEALKHEEYRTIIGEYNNIRDLEKVPIIDAKFLMRLKNKAPYGGAAYFTSGTTGRPKMFVKSSSEIEYHLNMFAACFSEVIDEGDKVLVVTPKPRFPTVSDMYLEGGTRELTRRMKIMYYHVGINADLEMILNNSKPNALITFPSEAERISARYDYEFEKIGVGGEALTLGGRKILMDRFNPKFPILDGYGTTEVGMISWAANDEGIHKVVPTIYAKVVDENGEEVSEGEEGQIILTMAFPLEVKINMPVVNYRIGDVVRVEELKERYSDGKLLERELFISHIRRVQDETVISGANFSHIEVHNAISRYINEYPFTGKYDVIVERTSPGHYLLTIEVESTGTVDKSAEEKLLNEILTNNPPLRNEVTNGNIEIEMKFLEPGKLKMYEHRGKEKKLWDLRE